MSKYVTSMVAALEACVPPKHEIELGLTLVFAQLLRAENVETELRLALAELLARANPALPHAPAARIR